MLGEEWETWPENFIPDATFFTLRIYIANLVYLENGLSCFTKLWDDGTKKSNKILLGPDNTSHNPNNNNKQPPDQPGSKAKKVKKKEEKAQRR